VAHACNPTYSGGRHQEDGGSKSTPDKQFRKTPSRKKPSQKRAGEVAQGEGLEFKPQHHKKKKKHQN
jgi:hypothetical protein